ncbi:WhiB family transcriptional regulator [Streptomyces sp. DH12]|uniref:WhiB family transcriptional regulator n=1 Tax=Streptomyces sp. DH12 TaxID=2857010 RepID=UPI001E2B748F|nr:WhiB family transcriptional regulator [Streptomyces sp. DH12]
MSLHWATHWNYAPETRRPADWRHFAACRDVDPDLFFPTGTTGPAIAQAEEARSVCHSCPVMQTCRQWALDTRLEEGVAGGLTEGERRSIHRKRRRTAS